MIRKKPVQHERAEQMALFEWAEAMSAQYPQLQLMFSITNSGLHHIHYAKLLNKLGRKKGVPDIFLAVPSPLDYLHGLFIEMKPLNGGVTSKEQKGWHTALAGQGYQVEVCRGWVAASKVIMSYLRGV